MNKIIHKALMLYHNDFFKMTKEEQDIFKTSEHDELDKKVHAFVSKELNCDDEDDLDPKKQLEFNATMLHYKGVGENYFMLNEWGSDDDVIKYDNLYDYNVNAHNFQESCIKLDADKNKTDYKPTELYDRFAAWARAEIDGEFSYLNLVSLQMWVFWEAESVLDAWVDKEIPHEYVSGKDDGKKVKGGISWNKVVDANGLEGWYEQLRTFEYKILGEIFDDVKYLGDVVYVENVTNKFFDEYDPSLNYIFGSLDVLKDLTFVNFIEDAKKKLGNFDDLKKHRDEIIKNCIIKLEEKMVEIKKTPPNVIPLTKKMKMVISDGAMDDLDNL